MRNLVGITVLALVTLSLPATPAQAASVPFTESFASGDSGWRGNPNTPGSLDWSAEGYVSEAFNFLGSTAGAQGPILFRGPASASGGSFAGDWLADGVSEVHLSVRHDADVPVTFFARFATPMGFPAAIAMSFAPIAASSEWTELVFAIDPLNPQFVSFEGSSFETVFAGIGTVQLGVAIPESLAGVDSEVRFDVASVSLVPEPGGLGAMALAAVALLISRRVFGGRGSRR